MRHRCHVGSFAPRAPVPLSPLLRIVLATTDHLHGPPCPQAFAHLSPLCPVDAPHSCRVWLFISPPCSYILAIHCWTFLVRREPRGPFVHPPSHFTSRHLTTSPGEGSFGPRRDRARCLLKVASLRKPFAKVVCLPDVDRDPPASKSWGAARRQSPRRGPWGLELAGGGSQPPYGRMISHVWKRPVFPRQAMATLEHGRSGNPQERGDTESWVQISQWQPLE